MRIETSKRPTHIALVGRRLNMCHQDDLANTFLETSYLAEVALKSMVVALQAGLRSPAPEIAYRHAYELVRAEGLGTWQETFRQATTQPIAAYLPMDFFPLLAWASKKRTKPEDDWFQQAMANARTVLVNLGVADEDIPRSNTIRDLFASLVVIRNKTKAHGAVGQDFYAVSNEAYLEAVKALLHNCPSMQWRWLHLSVRQTGKRRGIALTGPEPRHMKDSEAAAFAVTAPGVHFVPDQSSHAYYCGELLLANRDCNVFMLPNGGATASGQAEFLDYATGKTAKESISRFISPPAPLPPSVTAGQEAFDIQSNVFGNLPDVPNGYVRRRALEAELSQRLCGKQNTIITLHGGGGMGKTSLALRVAHDLANHSDPPFEHIVWFSARDVDLRLSGPSSVRPAVLDLKSISKKFGELFSLYGIRGNIEDFAKVLQTPEGLSQKGILFIFDNFETIAEVRELHQFLDQHTRLPNKILITSREHVFKGDYPIEVRGMEFEEAGEMLRGLATELHVEGLVSDSVIESIYKYTGGHAYVMRVILGEMAKEGRYTPPAVVMGKRNDIVDAVFERSFNKLSDAGRALFLTVSNWKAEVPELALLVVLGVRGIDVSSGLEECRKLSLVFPIDRPGGYRCYSSPPLARVFGHKKLQGDPDRLVIQEDLLTVQKFGVLPKTETEGGAQEKLIEKFVQRCVMEGQKDVEAFARADRLLVAVANLWPRGWLSVAELRERAHAESQSVSYALRRAVEEQPFSKQAWLKRAQFAEKQKDHATQIASLVSAVDADPADVQLIREVAFQLCRYINAHLSEIPKARRGVYLASVRAHMERVAHKLDATGLSRLAWLFLLEDNVEKAREYANRGCEIDSTNCHCLKILQRLDNQVQHGYEE